MHNFIFVSINRVNENEAKGEEKKNETTAHFAQRFFHIK